jgi:hypothetical protein
MSRAALEGAKRELERERLIQALTSESSVCFSSAARDRLGPSISYVYAGLGPINPDDYSSPGINPLDYPSPGYPSHLFQSSVDHHLASIRVLSVSPISYPSSDDYDDYDYTLPPRDCLPARDVDIVCERIQVWIRLAYPEAENSNVDLGMPHLDATGLFYNWVVRLMAVLLVVLKTTPRIVYIAYVQPEAFLGLALLQIPDVLRAFGYRAFS